MLKEELLEQFLAKNIEHCLICGSQRCDGSLDWVEGCKYWKDFFAEQT